VAVAIVVLQEQQTQVVVVVETQLLQETMVQQVVRVLHW
jgi:hypothetical protein